MFFAPTVDYGWITSNHSICSPCVSITIEFPELEILSKGLRMKRKASADATRCVHSGEERHGQAAPLTTPIAQTAVFVLPDVDRKSVV